MSDTTQVSNTTSVSAEGDHNSSANLGLDPNASLQDIMNFDPFGDKIDNAKTEKGKISVEDKKPVEQRTKQPQAGEPTKKVETTPATVTTPTGDPAKTPTPETDLAKIVQQQTETIRQMVEQTTKSTQPSSEPAKPQPKFQLQLPQPLIEAIESDDPQKRSLGLNALVNGVANSVWDAVLGHIQETVLPGIHQSMSTYTQGVQQQKQTFDDFYGTFPQLNNEALYPFVQTVAQQLAQAEMAQTGKFAWTPAFRDKLGNAVLALMQQAGGKAPVSPPPAPPPANTRFVNNGGGARPAPTKPNEFLEILGF